MSIPCHACYGNTRLNIRTFAGGPLGHYDAAARAAIKRTLTGPLRA
ncbi:MAG TPA: hypothetical protein VJN88_12290 [Ktedonobacterales bacterium]|nr:hypothetical protein [Ktedonobacterales bacterium]